MRIKRLQAVNFRNLQQLVLEASPSSNVIYGDNAQGKTNIIEAIWLFSGNKSFRGAHEKEMIRFDCPSAELTLTFEDEVREQNARLVLGGKDRKKVFLNGVPQESQSALSGRVACVVFSPAHLSLVRDGPGVRRKFMDAAVCQINLRYREYLSQYEKVLAQRNALLKDVVRFPDLRDTLDVWDLQMAKLGTILTIYRQEYAQKISRSAAEFYRGFAKENAEPLSAFYRSTAFPQGEEITAYTDEAIGTYYQAVKQSYEQDLRLGFTTVGIHRDDLELMMDGRELRTYGSQGQQRSTVLALKLSEAQILKTVTGENPVMLLDDVMSELDAARQDYILNHVQQFQVFLTCCDAANTFRLREGTVFHIQNGGLTAEKTL